MNPRNTGENNINSRLPESEESSEENIGEDLENGHGLLNAISQEAQRALKERPSFSIRARLTIGFALWIILSLGATILSLVTLTKIETKLFFIEATTNYTFELQEARRYEKNFFLYGTSLNDALAHEITAKKILDAEKKNIMSAVGKSNYLIMQQHFMRYQELLEELRNLSRNGEKSPDRIRTIESELRQHGAEMISKAKNLVIKEREDINVMLRLSRRTPLLFLVLLICLVLYLTFFIGRQMLAPLNRMMVTTRQIAEGNFTPITPHRKFRDEFTELAMAINHMMHKLTHRQDMLVQMHKLKAVGTLTAGVAHELNNPLNNIVLTAAMLMEDHDDLSDEDLMDMLSDLVEQSERAQKIVRNLLDFARESEMEAQLVQTRDILKKTLQLAANQITLSRIKTHCVYTDNLPPILGDFQQLAQVFLNIMLNAVDAMPRGGSLTIETEYAPDRDFISVKLTDTGPGISENNLSMIFDPFFTSKPRGKGTGLGLSVSLGIIKKHGGEIHVRSNKGQGTTFDVHLPIARAPF